MARPASATAWASAAGGGTHRQGSGSLVFAFWAGPRLWALAQANGFLTLGDFLEWRYGRSVRALTSVLIWFVSLSILAGQLLGASSILQVVAGLPRWVGAVTAAGVVVVYFVAGGLLSSAWVNLVQLAVKLSGFAIALPLALATVGGWDGLRTAEALPDRFFDVTGGSGIDALVAAAPGTGIHRVARSRAEGVRRGGRQGRSARRWR